MIISRAVLSSQQGPQGGSVVWKPCEAGMVGHLLGKQPGEGRTPPPPSSPTNMPQKGERTPCTHTAPALSMSMEWGHTAQAQTLLTTDFTSSKMPSQVLMR